MALGLDGINYHWEAAVAQLDPDLTAADLLAEARTILIEQGWTQRTLEDDSGRVCLQGAWNTARSRDAWQPSRYTREAQELAQSALGLACWERLLTDLAAPRRFSPSSVIPGFNDLSSTTEQDALAVMEDAVLLAKGEQGACQVFSIFRQLEAHRLGAMTPPGTISSSWTFGKTTLAGAYAEAVKADHVHVALETYLVDEEEDFTWPPAVQAPMPETRFTAQEIRANGATLLQELREEMRQEVRASKRLSGLDLL
jgi:hypothetical protein